MMIAFEAAASITSDSVMPPTPSRTVATVTCCCGSFATSSASASSEPATSALMTSGSSASSPACARLKTSSSETRTPWRRASDSVLSRWRALARELARAVRSFSTTRARSPASGHAVEAEHLDRHAGRGLGDPLAAVVVHRAHAAPVRAGHERVADLQRAAVHEQADDGAAARVEPRLDDRARSLGVRVRLELLELGDRDDRLEQVRAGSASSSPRRPRTRCRRPSRPA